MQHAVSHAIAILLSGLVLVLTALAGAPALAALPPLSPGEQAAMSSYIVTGVVLSIDVTPGQSRGGFRDDHVRMRIEVVDAQRASLKRGEVLVVETWVSGSRPGGWAGPGRQRGLPMLGQSAVFYLDAGLHLIEPNGWEPVR